jgi:hypothetical protein
MEKIFVQNLSFYPCYLFNCPLFSYLPFHFVLFGYLEGRIVSSTTVFELRSFVFLSFVSGILPLV